MRARADAAARSAGARTRSADEAVASLSATRKKTLFLAIFASSSATREGIWLLAILAPAHEGLGGGAGDPAHAESRVIFVFPPQSKKKEKGAEKDFRNSFLHLQEIPVVNIKSGTFQVVSK